MGNTETKGRREGRETQHDDDTDPESRVSERFHVDLVDPRTPFTSSVDAVVCYIDQQWSDSDQLNSTLLDLGGNRYESHRTHLRTKYPQCSVGDVHIGRGEKLPCEVVLFCVVPMVAEDGQIGEDYGQMVTMAIDKVFHTALSCTQEINIRSIAFPMATGGFYCLCCVLDKKNSSYTDLQKVSKVLSRFHRALANGVAELPSRYGIL